MKEDLNLCVPENVFRSRKMECKGQLIDDGTCTMLSFGFKDFVYVKKAKEKKLLMDCCIIYKWIVMKKPEYEGFYGHIVMPNGTTHYVESFDKLEAELMALK